MELNKFVQLFAEQFESVDPATITAQTDYKSLKGWSSIVVLMIIGMVEDEFDTVIGAKEIINSTTVADLFDEIRKRHNGV